MTRKNLVAIITVCIIGILVFCGISLANNEIKLISNGITKDDFSIAYSIEHDNVSFIKGEKIPVEIAVTISNPTNYKNKVFDYAIAYSSEDSRIFF